MPIHRQCGPPQSRVMRLFSSQHLDAPRVVPDDPLVINGVVPVGRSRQPQAGGITKAAGAVDALANAAAFETAPTVVRDPVGMTALDDLAQDLWQELVVVSAVHARDVAIFGAIRPALG